MHPALASLSLVLNGLSELSAWMEATDAASQSHTDAVNALHDEATAARAELTIALDGLNARVAALEEVVARLTAGTTTPTPSETHGDAPWPAPVGFVWLRIPEGAGLQTGEAIDVQGRTLRIPDGVGYVRALVPATAPTQPV